MTTKLYERKSGAVVARDAKLDGAAEFDIIVAGLGTAGSIAAISAAEQGMRVLGLERLNAMGGTGTIGAVVGYYFGNKGGLFEEIDRDVQALAKDPAYTKAGGINADLKELVLERRAAACGVSFRYESTVIGVYREGSKVVGVRWVGTDGVQSARCRVLIDCTGDAEVAATAGASYWKGRGIDGKMQPFSNALVWIEGDTVRTFYTDSGYVDIEDGESVSRAVIESANLYTHQPERFSEERKFVKLAPLLGVREGRFIRAEEQVTFTGFLEGRESKEPLFYAYSNLDNHGKDMAFESEAQRDWTVASNLWGVNFSVPIPLGALIPQGLEGLLVAGRSLGVDHDLASCVRMKRDMQKCGEAAGLAAALSVKLGAPIRSIPYEKLKPLLQEKGCLREANNRGLRFSMPSQDDSMSRIDWLQHEEEIKEGLAGEKPGIAIWSARRIGDAIRPALREWMNQEENIHLRRHSAFALALLKDEAAIPVLRETVRERDAFFPKTGRKYNQARGYTAIYLLGKLQDEGIVPELLKILQDRESFKNVSTDAEFINHDDEYFFQYFTFALIALFQIADRYASHRAAVLETARAIVDDPSFSLYVTLKPSKDLSYDMADTIREIVRRQAAAWARDAEDVII
jgi:hypothetical protein